MSGSERRCQHFWILKTIHKTHSGICSRGLLLSKRRARESMECLSARLSRSRMTALCRSSRMKVSLVSGPCRPLDAYLHGLYIGRDVVLLFEGGDPVRPLIVGFLHDPHSADSRTAEAESKWMWTAIGSWSLQRSNWCFGVARRASR